MALSAFFLAMSCGADVRAADLNIALDASGSQSVFGLSAAAKESEFRQLLGEPAAVIAMNKQRHGLLYGTNILLIFAGDKLWQARTWFVPPWSPQLYQGWLQYVLPVTTRDGAISSFTVNRNLKLGGKRAPLEKMLGQSVLDADEFSTVARFGDADVWLGYAYPDEGDAKRSVATQTVVSLVVEYRSAPGGE
jgi:hypothetical protein